MERQIKPQFHYTYKKEGIILDSQYNTEGNILAVATSQGQVIFYQSQMQQSTRQPLYIISENNNRLGERKSSPAILKVGWSDPAFKGFVTANVQKTIKLYSIQKCLPHNNPIKTTHCEWIPSALCFCPIDKAFVLTVGFSNGQICLYGQNLQELSIVDAHEQSVNCLSWQIRLSNSIKNQWISNHFSYIKPYQDQQEFPYLISCSSDMYIKIWRFDGKSLHIMAKKKAHDKQIREVQWKPNCFNTEQRSVVSCSQDGYVRIWTVKILNKFTASLQIKSERNFNGPVYKSLYNYSGTAIAISYLKQTEQKIQTQIMSQKHGILSIIQKPI